MKAEIQFIILLLFLFYGSYATLVVKTDFEPQRISQIRAKQLKKDLTEKDYAFMNMVLNEDDAALEKGELSSSGSVIVKNGKIIGRGKGPLVDPISHAEVQAVRRRPQSFGYDVAGWVRTLFKHSALPDVSVITLFNKRG